MVNFWAKRKWFRIEWGEQLRRVYDRANKSYSLNWFDGHALIRSLFRRKFYQMHI